MYKPYNHQIKAIKNVSKALKKEARTQLIMSCGTGKSLTSMWVHESYIKDLENSITILFYPSLFLVNQTYNTYKENSILHFTPLVVCSDTAIGNNEDDIFEIDVSEVKYPVSTNIEDIKLYLQDRSIKHKIVFITYQSCELIGAALNELGMKASLGIYDEAHKTATLNIDSKFAYGLKDENIPIAKRLFMTATPRHIKFDVNNEDEEVELFSMNNPELYGNIAYEYPMREAINDGIITDYKIMGILIDDKYIDSYTNELKPFSDDVINEAKIKAINEAMIKYKLNKALVFNRDIAASKELEKYSNTLIFNKTIKHLDGSSSHKYREEVLKELRDNKQYVISNAKLFTEGVDLPVIDMIALFRNVKSEIDIIQTVGRVQRVDKNNPNKIGYILLPIFISNIDNIDEELKTNKDLEYVYETINSLKENDEQLRTTLEYKKQNSTKSNKSKDKKDLEIENPNFEINYISNNDTTNFINEINEKITHKIEAVILNKKGKIKTENEWKELFIDFIKENGIENLKQSTKYKNIKIGSKFSDIKVKYNKSNPYKQKQMREFWDCFPNDFWERKIPESKTEDEWKELFIDFIKENGIENLNTTTKFKNENLGRKLHKIKSKYNKSNPDEQKKIREFWDCFPDDFWGRKASKPKTEDEWKELFIDFIKENGIENLNTTTKYKAISLGSGISRIRTKYNKLTPDEQKEMREFWDCFPNDFWERKIPESKTEDEWKELFIDFIKENGIENLNSRTKYKAKSLGSGISRIKTKYNKLTPDEQKEMREFWDCFSDDFWERKK